MTSQTIPAIARNPAAPRRGGHPASPAARSTALVLRAALAALTLAACATPDRDVAVRHFPSTAYHEGTPFHLFVFDPEEERPLAARIRIARNQIRAEPGCTWKDVPTVVIAEATARQGEPWAETLLAAPVECAA